MEEDSEVPPSPSVEEQKSLRAAVIGESNAGKSTLINQLLRQKVKCRRANKLD